MNKEEKIKKVKDIFIQYFYYGLTDDNDALIKKFNDLIEKDIIEDYSIDFYSEEAYVIIEYEVFKII